MYVGLMDVGAVSRLCPCNAVVEQRDNHKDNGAMCWVYKHPALFSPILNGAHIEIFLHQL
jgi:hypothetical protein